MAAYDLADPLPGARLTPDYLRAVGQMAYLWGWPMVNLHNRRESMRQLPTPGLLGGIAPAAPAGRLAMLHSYVEPAERLVACPNQDVAYGFGLLSAETGPSVLQIPDTGDRFWVCQMVDQRTESFATLGKMYGSSPGFYLLAPSSWQGEVPAGIVDVFRYDTRVGVVIPRFFLDDTDEDRAAILPLVNQVSMYPMAEFTGEAKLVDWSRAPSYGEAAAATGGAAETLWVKPETYLAQLGVILTEVPARPGEEALYAWLGSLVGAAATDDRAAAALHEAAATAEQGLVQELFQFRNIGLPQPHHWSTQRNGAAYGADYLSRTAMAKANIFVNLPSETAYYYQDLDTEGERLDGNHRYTITFPAGQLPPVQGFWSMTLYNEQHFFHANPLRRYSLGTKNKTLVHAPDGALTLTAGADEPDDPAEAANWLPSPRGPFSLYLRAYWPDEQVLRQEWTPPAVLRR